jgi:hypothetical protein
LILQQNEIITRNGVLAKNKDFLVCVWLFFYVVFFVFFQQSKKIKKRRVFLAYKNCQQQKPN